MTAERRHTTLLAVLLLAAAVRGVGATAEGLWLDEIYGLARVAVPLEQLVYQPADPHPPLFYLLLQCWTGLAGTSELALRWPSVLAGIGAVAVLYTLARQAWPKDERVALLAAGLLALSPMHVWYSQEARMYALVCVLVTAAGLAALLALRRGRARYVAAYVVLALAALYTDYSALLALVAGTAWLALERSRGNRRAGTLLLANVAVAAGSLPWWARFLVHFDMVVQPGLLAMRLRPVAELARTSPGLAIVLVAAAFVMVIAVALAARGAWRVRGSAAALGTTPVLAVWLIAWLGIIVWTLAGRGLTLQRQGTVLLPLLMLGTAQAVARPATWRTAGRALAAGCLAVSALAVAYLGWTAQKEAWRAVGSLLAAEEQPGDGVYLAPDYAQPGLEYYRPGQSARHGLDPGRLTDRVLAEMAQFPRIWVVLYNGALTDPEGRVGNWLDARFRRLETHPLRRIEVRLYATR